MEDYGQGKALNTIDNIEIHPQNQSFVDVNNGNGMFTKLGHK